MEVNAPKPNSNSISLSTSSNAAPHADGGVGGLCCWCQRLRTSKSDSCLPCMQCLRRPERGHYHHCRHFTASGESGFVSDSDNARRRRRHYQRLHEPTALAEQRNRNHFRSLSFPLPINLLRCLLTSQPSESSKGNFCTYSSATLLLYLKRIRCYSEDFSGHASFVCDSSCMAKQSILSLYGLFPTLLV